MSGTSVSVVFVKRDPPLHAALYSERKKSARSATTNEPSTPCHTLGFYFLIHRFIVKEHVVGIVDKHFLTAEVAAN